MKKLYSLFLGSFAMILCLVSANSFGAVGITAPTLAISACSYPSNYYTLGDIVISAGQNSDFVAGTNVRLVLTAPTNFEFEASTGTVNFAAGFNIQSASIVVTASTITVTYTSDNTTLSKKDVLTISGIKVHATANSVAVTMKSTGSTCNITGVTHGTTVFGTFSSSIATGTNGSYAGSTVALSSTMGCGAATYTFTTKTPNSAGCNLTTNNVMTVTFPAGTNALTCTGGTFAGVALGTLTKTATTVTFNCSKAVGINRALVIVLDGITNGNSINSSCSISSTNASCGTNTYTGFAFTTAACPCTPPTTQVSGFSATAITDISMTLNWTGGNGDNVLVVARAGSAVTADPVIGTTYTASATYGLGTQIGAGNYVIYSGPAATMNLVGLTQNTTYHFAFYEYNAAGMCYMIPGLKSSATTIAATCTPPTSQATAFSATAINTTSMTLNWVRGVGGTGVMVIASAVAGSTDPTNGVAYTASTTYGSGTAVGGGFCVFNGAGTSVTITGLTQNTTYYFAIYEYAAGPCFHLTQLIGSATTLAAACTPPATQTTAFASSAITTSSMTVSWTDGSGDRVMVIASDAGAPTDPSNGVAYAANAAYGSGDAVGGGFCVFNGVGTSVALTALMSNTTYYFAIYEYNSTGTCYHLTQLTGNATTLAGALAITIGTGTSTSSAPTPYRGYFWGAREQYIITASELAAQGLYAGCTLTSLSFNVATKASTQRYTGYTIKLAHTTASSYASATFLAPSFTTVYNSNYTSVAGWNLHGFSTNFTWDGSSNLVVEVCFQNTSYTAADAVYYTTATNTVCYAAQDASGACTLSGSSTSSNRPNMKFAYTPGAPCSGTPTGGTTAASPASICFGESSLIQLSGATAGSGITYKWQSAPAAAGPWTDIAGATALSYSASPLANTYYRCKVTCSNGGLMGYSASSLVSVTNCVIFGTGTSTTTYPYTGNYEDSRSQYIITAAELLAQGLYGGCALTSVAFNVSSKASTLAYTGFSINIGHTSASTFAAATFLAPTFTACYSTNYTVGSTGWNQHIFTSNFVWDGSSNIVVQACYDNADYSSNDPVYCTTVNNTVAYKSMDAGTGCTMAAASYGSSRPNMKFTFLPGANCSGLPAAGTATATPNSICPGSSSVLTLAANTIGNGISFQWQSSPDNATWTNIGGATAATYTASPTTNTYYRCKDSCSFSNLRSFTVGILVTVLSPSYATVPFSESFEGPWLNRCDMGDVPSIYWLNSPKTGNNSWRRDDDGTSGAWSSPTSYVYTPVFTDISHSARFHAGSATSGNVGTLDLYMNLSTQLGTKILKFDYINTSGTDKLDLQFSSDNGLTFTTLQTYALAATWESKVIDIASNSATCIIRFKATADFGSTDIGLDKCVVVGPCNGMPAAGTATIDNSTFCVSGSPVLTLTGYSAAGGITLQWQSSPTNAPYAWTDIAGATTDVFVVPTLYQTTYFRCAVRCISDVAYSAPISYTNTAGSIVTTNSPVSVACNAAAALSATPSVGSTVKWYASSTGGAVLGSGNNYNTGSLSANTTFYCAANSGSTVETAGMPTNTGTYASTSTGYGVIFNVTKAITLNSVTIYPNGKADVVIALQNSSGVEQFATASIATNGNGTTPQVINTGGWSIPIGTAYRLVLKTYTATTGTGLTYSSSTSYPYTSASGAVSVTSGWYGTGTSSTNYHFYNLNFSIPCESSPRTPVQVNVTSGVTAPVCSSPVTPLNNATGICPVGTTLTWTASVTPCRTATSYLLSWGYNVAGNDQMNRVDIGNVTSYNLGNVNGNDDIYWVITPVNFAGEATCAASKFTTVANPGSICNTMMGTGVVNVASLPYTHNNGTTSGTVDDLNSSNLVTCGSTSYFTGEDKVWVFTPATSGTVTVTLTSTGTYTGLAIYEGCPLAAGVCGAPAGACVGYAQDYSGDKTLTVCVTAGVTYYLILDSYDAPDFNPYSKLIISAPSGTVVPANDKPCAASPLTLGLSVAGNNSCAGSALEPANPTCWTSGVRHTVWYTVVAPTSGQLSIKAETGTLSNTQIALYSGSCSGLIAVPSACNNDVSGCGSSLASLMNVTGLTPGETYYIVVDGGYDLQGTFTILAIDPATMTFPVVPGQDCNASLPVCQTIMSIPDPGYSNTGATCDFNGDDNCTGGERASLWYTITMLTGGTLQFDIIPNDYDGTEGSETDYDFLVWKITGSGTTTNCANIATSSDVALVACNYSYLGVTGLYPGGGGNPDYEGGTPWDAAYEDVITTQAGDQYLLCISNFTQSTSGFTIDYVSSGGTATINTSAVPPVLFWTGAQSTAWATNGNWGGCSIPSCLTSAVINPAPNNPIISANQTVNDLTINLGATLTINTGCTLSVCGNFMNNGTIIANGTIEFISADPQTYTNTNVTPLKNVTMNQPTPSTLTLFSDLRLSASGILTLTSGKIVTGTNTVIANNTATNAVTTGNATSYVEGNLRRYILSTGSYDFPVGHASKGYERANVNFTGATTITNLTAFFVPYPALPTVALTGCGTVAYNAALDDGYWTITPDPLTSNNSGVYTMTLYNSNYTNFGSSTAWTIMSDHGSGWNFLNGNASASTCVASPVTAVQRSAMNGFSKFGTALSNGPLPVELLSFTGENAGDKNILEWVTATEINNDYFVLEKSENGVNFKELAVVDGAGNSNNLLHYDYIDYKPIDPVTYYKLKQVDFDGAYTYSDIIAINKYSSDDAPLFINLYPNPATSAVDIELFTPSEDVATAEIYDHLGMLVLSKTLDLKKGLNIFTFNIDAFATGLYYFRVNFKTPAQSSYKKFIKH